MPEDLHQFGRAAPQHFSHAATVITFERLATSRLKIALSVLAIVRGQTHLANMRFHKYPFRLNQYGDD